MGEREIIILYYIYYIREITVGGEGRRVGRNGRRIPGSGPENAAADGASGGEEGQRRRRAGGEGSRPAGGAGEEGGLGIGVGSDDEVAMSL